LSCGQHRSIEGVTGKRHTNGRAKITRRCHWTQASFPSKCLIEKVCGVLINQVTVDLERGKGVEEVLGMQQFSMWAS
jgi:hypothetical protein